MAVKDAHSSRIKVLAPNSHLVEAVLKKHYREFDPKCRERLRKHLDVILTGNKNNVNDKNVALQILKRQTQRLGDPESRNVNYLRQKLWYSTSELIRESESKILCSKPRNISNNSGNEINGSKSGGHSHLHTKRKTQSPTDTNIKYVGSKSAMLLNQSNINFRNKTYSAGLKQQRASENLKNTKRQRSRRVNIDAVTKPAEKKLTQNLRSVKSRPRPWTTILSTSRSCSPIKIIVETSNSNTSISTRNTPKPLSSNYATSRPSIVEKTTNAFIATRAVPNPWTAKISTSKSSTIKIILETSNSNTAIPARNPPRPLSSNSAKLKASKSKVKKTQNVLIGTPITSKPWTRKISTVKSSTQIPIILEASNSNTSILARNTPKSLSSNSATLKPSIVEKTTNAFSGTPVIRKQWNKKICTLKSSTQIPIILETSNSNTSIPTPNSPNPNSVPLKPSITNLPSARTSTGSKHPHHQHKNRNSAPSQKGSWEDTKSKPNSRSKEEKKRTDEETIMNLLKDVPPFISSSRKINSVICSKSGSTTNESNSSSIKADTIHVKNPRVDKGSLREKNKCQCHANTGQNSTPKKVDQETFESPDRSYVAKMAIECYLVLIHDMQKNCTIFKKFSKELIRPVRRRMTKCVRRAYYCWKDYIGYMNRTIEILHPYITEQIVECKMHKQAPSLLEFDTSWPKLLVCRMRGMLAWKRAFRNAIASYEKEMDEWRSA